MWRTSNCVSAQVAMARSNNSATTTVNDSALGLTEQVVESILAMYIMPIIIAVGTVGNLTSLAVLLRRRMRRTSVYLYLTALALADISVLYISAFKTWIRLVCRSASCWTFDYQSTESIVSCVCASLSLQYYCTMKKWIIKNSTVCVNIDDIQITRKCHSKYSQKSWILSVFSYFGWWRIIISQGLHAHCKLFSWRDNL